MEDSTPVIYTRMSVENWNDVVNDLKNISKLKVENIKNDDVTIGSIGKLIIDNIFGDYINCFSHAKSDTKKVLFNTNTIDYVGMVSGKKTSCPLYRVNGHDEEQPVYFAILISDEKFRVVFPEFSWNYNIEAATAYGLESWNFQYKDMITARYLFDDDSFNNYLSKIAKKRGDMNIDEVNMFVDSLKFEKIENTFEFSILGKNPDANIAKIIYSDAATDMGDDTLDGVSENDKNDSLLGNILDTVTSHQTTNKSKTKDSYTDKDYDKIAEMMQILALYHTDDMKKDDVVNVLKAFTELQNVLKENPFDFIKAK